jgi:hypothetical protein
MNLAGTSEHLPKIGRSGLGKQFWNIKVKKCRAKAAASTNAGPVTHGANPPHPGVGNEVLPMRDLPRFRV